MKTEIDYIGEPTEKALLKLFLPLLCAMILTMIYSMVDSLWVGNLLGERGLSALTAGTAIVLIMSSLSMGMGNGVSVMIAQMLGAGEKEKVGDAAAAILTVSAGLAIASLVLMELLTTRILVLMGTPSEILEDAAVYLRWYLVGNVALFLYMQFTSIFRAFGDSMFQMKGMLMTALLNAVLDPVLIRRSALLGAAEATVLSEILCLVYALIYYRKRRYFKLGFSGMKMEYVKTMMSLSIPTTIQSVMPALSSAVMVSFVTSFGTQAIAGFGVARNLEYFMFMPTTALSMALTSIIGRCCGAEREDRAEDYLRTGWIFGGGLIALISVLVIVFSGQLTVLFGQDAAVAAIVAGYFRVLSIGFVLYLITSCMQAYMTGMGRPGTAMVLLILYYILFRIPSAVILKAAFGLSGVWMGFLTSHVLALAAGAMMLRKMVREERMSYDRVVL